MKSIKDMLKIAIMPLGKTMYIYGGGWNEADTGAGRECLTYGISPKWAEFANNQDSNYSYKNYDYKKDKSVIHLGLDCSGYVGWVLFNTLADGRGYVFKSTEVVKSFYSMGLGKRTERNGVKDFKAGDIFSSACDCCAHVYICVGKCSDDSVVLLHSSPNGVQLSGTYSPEGDDNSRAIILAREYMTRYYPRWMARYPDITRNTTYLTHYEQLENTFLSDKEGLREKSAEEVLALVFRG